MNWLAVILAAVAALAATAQSYLLWTERRDPDAERIHLQRVQICEGALASLYQAARIAENHEARLQAAINRLKAQQRPGSAQMSEEEVSRYARTLILGGHSYFVVYNYAPGVIYFSDAERAAIGFDEISVAFDGFGEGQEYDERIAQIAIAAEKVDSAEKVCRPIMLGKAL